MRQDKAGHYHSRGQGGEWRGRCSAVARPYPSPLITISFLPLSASLILTSLFLFLFFAVPLFVTSAQGQVKRGQRHKRN